MRERLRRARFGRKLLRTESRAFFRHLTLGLFLSTASCGLPFAGSESESPNPGPCQVEVWNDNAVAVQAWYGATREDLGTLPPHQSVVLPVACAHERITFGGAEVEGDRETTPVVVGLEPGETKLAQLRLPEG